MEIEAEDDEQGGWEIVKQETKKAIDSNEEPTVSAMAFTILTIVQYCVFVSTNGCIIIRILHCCCFRNKMLMFWMMSQCWEWVWVLP